MRVTKGHGGLSVQAIAGAHVVILAMHMYEDDSVGLLGFAFIAPVMRPNNRTGFRE
jgi:hypothetical protein